MCASEPPGQKGLLSDNFLLTGLLIAYPDLHLGEFPILHLRFLYSSTGYIPQVNSPSRIHVNDYSPCFDQSPSLFPLEKSVLTCLLTAVDVPLMEGVISPHTCAFYKSMLMVNSKGIQCLIIYMLVISFSLCFNNFNHSSIFIIYNIHAVQRYTKVNFYIFCI